MATSTRSQERARPIGLRSTGDPMVRGRGEHGVSTGRFNVEHLEVGDADPEVLRTRSFAQSFVAIAGPISMA